MARQYDLRSLQDFTIQPRLQELLLQLPRASLQVPTSLLDQGLHGVLFWVDLVALQKAIHFFGVFLFFLLEHLQEQDTSESY